MRRKWIWVAAVLLLVSLITIGLDEEARVEATVELRKINPQIVARAKVEAAQGVSKIRTLVDGRLVKVLVQEGENVEQGKLVAVIKNPTVDAELERARAGVRRAEAELATITEGMRPEQRSAHDAAVRALEQEVGKARAAWKRKSKLFERQITSHSEFDQATLGLRGAEARLDQARARARMAHAGGRKSEITAAKERVLAARANLERAESDFAHKRLVAPMAGTVVARRGNPGDIVFPDATQKPIIEIADLDALEVRIEVEQIDAHRLRPELPVRLLSAEERAHIGDCSITRIGKRLQSRKIGVEDARLRAVSQVRPAWCRVDPDRIKRQLLLDQRLEAVIALPAASAVAAIPRNAVYIDHGRAYVDRPGAWWPEQTAVTLGARDSEYVEVRDLRAGDKVLQPASR